MLPAKLPDGRTILQATIELILQVLRGEVLVADETIPRKASNYSLYQQVAFLHLVLRGTPATSVLRLAVRGIGAL